MPESIFRLVYILIFSLPYLASAQSVDPRSYIEQATAYIDFSVVRNGDPSKERYYGQRVSSQSTGFLIDAEGHVVTTLHSLSGLEPYDKNPSTIKINVRLGDIYTNPRPAGIIHSDPTKDLLILKVALPANIKPVIVSNSAIQAVRNNNRRVCGFGLHKSGNVHEPCGKVSGFQGPSEEPYLWPTNFIFGLGLSGGPVFLSNDGTVVGVIKGRYKGDDANIGYMIPMSWVRRILPEIPTTQTKLIVQDSDLETSIMQKGKITYVVNETVLKRERKTETFFRRNKHCQSPQEFTLKFTPSEGYIFDLESVKLETNISSKTPKPSIEISTDSIIVKGKIKNNGSCIKALGNFIAKDGRGSISGVLEYEEILIVQEESLVEQNLSFELGAITEAEIPIGAREIILSHNNNGQTKLVTENYPSGILSIKTSAETGKVIIDASQSYDVIRRELDNDPKVPAKFEVMQSIRARVPG